MSLFSGEVHLKRHSKINSATVDVRERISSVWKHRIVGLKFCSNYGVPDIFSADVHIASSTPVVEAPEVISFKLEDIIGGMINFWNEAGNPVHWLSEAGNLEDNLQGLLATSDCCLTGESMRPIMRMQLSSDISTKSCSIITSNLVWNPPMISFEDLQTSVFEGTRLCFKPSCTFSRNRCSHSSVQYFIDTEPNWLYWNADLKCFEGIVPEYTSQTASNYSYDMSFVVITVIKTSFPGGVIFERIVRCQLRLNIMQAGESKANGEYDGAVPEKYEACSGEAANRHRTDNASSEMSVELGNSDDEYSRRRKQRDPNFDSVFYSTERLRSPEAPGFVGGVSASPCKKRNTLRETPWKAVIYQDDCYVEGAKSAKLEYSPFKTSKQELHDPRIVNKEAVVGNYQHHVCEREPLLGASKRIRRSKNAAAVDLATSKQEKDCYHHCIYVDSLKQHKGKTGCSRDINDAQFSSACTCSGQGEAQATRRFERSTPFCEAPLLLEGIHKTTAHDITNIFPEDACEGRITVGYDDNAYRTSSAQYLAKYDMISLSKDSLTDDIGNDLFWLEDSTYKRGNRLSNSISSCPNESQVQRQPSESSDTPSIVAYSTSSAGHSSVPVIPLTLHSSSGNSSPKTLNAKHRLTYFDSESNHTDLSDYTDPKGPCDFSSQKSHAYNDNSDVSTDPPYTAKDPQLCYQITDNDHMVSKNIDVLVKNMESVIESHQNESARSWERNMTLPDFRLVEAWPKPVTAISDITPSAYPREEAFRSCIGKRTTPSQQFRFEDRYRCDTPMMRDLDEAPFHSDTQLTARSEPSQSTILSLQKKYQENYEYFISLKACEAISSSYRHPMNESDKAEGRVYENIFLGMDGTCSGSELDD